MTWWMGRPNRFPLYGSGWGFTVTPYLAPPRKSKAQTNQREVANPGGRLDVDLCWLELSLNYSMYTKCASCLFGTKPKLNTGAGCRATTETLFVEPSSSPAWLQIEIRLSGIERCSFSYYLKHKTRQLFSKSSQRSWGVASIYIFIFFGSRKYTLSRYRLSPRGTGWITMLPFFNSSNIYHFPPIF